jgi:peptide subunit release factor 1 (eRF1)
MQLNADILEAREAAAALLQLAQTQLVEEYPSLARKRQETAAASAKRQNEITQQWAADLAVAGTPA